MNARDARGEALWLVALWARNHVDAGVVSSEGRYTEKDAVHVADAVEQLCAELEQRSRKLSWNTKP